MNAILQQTMRSSLRHVRAILIGLGLVLFAAGSTPVSAQTIYDTDFAERIKGLSPQVRAQLRTIMKESRAQFTAVLAKYGIDPNAKPSMDLLMKASKDLQAIANQEREAVRPLLKPDEMAQYYNLVNGTTQRVREALR